MSTGEKRSTTIVIVNFNSGGSLSACVESLLADGLLSGEEILVVDNASEDESLTECRKNHPRIGYRESGENIGYGAAINSTLDSITSDTLLILNPDTKMSGRTVRLLQEVLELDQEIALVAPITYFPDGSPQESVFRYPTFSSELLSGFGISRREVDYEAFPAVELAGHKVVLADWVRGSCMLCRTDVLRRCSGFNPLFFLYCEEIDLQKRIGELGYRIACCPELTICHERGVCMSQSPYLAYQHLFKSKVLYAGIHFGKLQSEILRLAFIVSCSIRYAWYSIKRVFGGGQDSSREAKKSCAALAELARLT